MHQNLRWESFTFRQRNRSGYGAKQSHPKPSVWGKPNSKPFKLKINVVKINVVNHSKKTLKINVVNPIVNHPKSSPQMGLNPSPNRRFIDFIGSAHPHRRPGNPSVATRKSSKKKTLKPFSGGVADRNSPPSNEVHQSYPLVNQQFDPGSHRGWKTNFH